MKRLLHFLLIVFAVFSCNEKSHADIAKKYYESLNAADFQKLSQLIGDSLTIVEGNYSVSYSLSSFYEQFKWDSTFNTSYKVIELINSTDSLLVTVESSSRRYRFLENDPLICRYEISFTNHKILQIKLLECPNADWNRWLMQRDSLVSWIKKKHPELDGFIHDLTKRGAINYLQAIDLYESRNSNDN